MFHKIGFIGRKALPYVVVAVVFFLLGAFFLPIGPRTSMAALFDRPWASHTEEEQNTPALQQLVVPEGQINIADMVERIGPAVVKIETEATTKGSQFQDPFFDDPFFRYFFGNSLPGMEIPQVRRGLGSGFIFNKDGLVLTNEHVVHGADKIKVIIQGQDEPLEAEVIGSDYAMDLAVLKLKGGKDLKTVPLGDSDQVRVGEWAVAVGNPFGLDHTVTVGVISAKGRPITIEDRHYKELIQTDAAINPGNSGGPLLNLKGEVIGINTAVDAGKQGIGFAIPINQVKEVLDQLIEKGEIIRPWLGVLIQPLDEYLAEYFNVPDTKGALIAQVMPGSPAEKAGLQKGDVIRKIEKTRVEIPDDLVKVLERKQVGDKVVLEIMRDGNTRFVTATIGKRENGA